MNFSGVQRHATGERPVRPGVPPSSSRASPSPVPCLHFNSWSPLDDATLQTPQAGNGGSPPGEHALTFRSIYSLLYLLYSRSSRRSATPTLDRPDPPSASVVRAPPLGWDTGPHATLSMHVILYATWRVRVRNSREGEGGSAARALPVGGGRAAALGSLTRASDAAVSCV